MTWESGEARKKIINTAARNEVDAKGYVTAYTMSNQAIIISPFPHTMINSVKDVYPTTFFLSHMPELICPYLQQLFNLETSVFDTSSPPCIGASLPLAVTLIIQNLKRRCSCINLQDAHELLVAEWATGGSAQQLFPLETHVPVITKAAWTEDTSVDEEKHIGETDIDAAARGDMDRTLMYKRKIGAGSGKLSMNDTDVDDVKVEETAESCHRDMIGDTLWDLVSVDSDIPFLSAIRTCCCAAFQTRRYSVLRALLLVLRSASIPRLGSDREGRDGDITYLLEKIG